MARGIIFYTLLSFIFLIGCTNRTSSKGNNGIFPCSSFRIISASGRQTITGKNGEHKKEEYYLVGPSINSLKIDISSMIKSINNIFDKPEITGRFFGNGLIVRDSLNGVNKILLFSMSGTIKECKDSFATCPEIGFDLIGTVNNNCEVMEIFAIKRE